VSANVGLSVEVRADGTVGNVTLANNPGFGLDDSAVAAAKKAVFLPAVKDGAFVDFIVKMEMSFSVR